MAQKWMTRGMVAGLTALCTALGSMSVSSTWTLATANVKTFPTKDKWTLSNVRHLEAQRQLTITHISSFPAYHALLVNAEHDPTYPNRFDWVDLQNGRDFTLPTGDKYTTLERVYSPTHIVLRATGRNASDGAVTVPYVMDFTRSPQGTSFVEKDEPIKFPPSYALTGGGLQKPVAVTQVYVDQQGLHVQFGPLSGRQGVMFYAGSVWIPDMQTRYDGDHHEFVVSFHRAVFSSIKSKTSHAMRYLGNPYIENLLIDQSGNTCNVAIAIRPNTGWYQAAIKTNQTAHGTSSVLFQFGAH